MPMNCPIYHGLYGFLVPLLQDGMNTKLLLPKGFKFLSIGEEDTLKLCSSGDCHGPTLGFRAGGKRI